MQFIQPILWQDAIDKIGQKSLIGSALSSEEWSEIPLELRERAFFSSTIENVRFLQRARDGITEFLSSAVETLPDGQKALATGSRQQFIKQMQDFAIAEGMGPLDAHDAGTIKDITSEGRLGLIFDVQTQSAEDYGYWKQGMDPDVLNEFPAQRFIREREVKQPRPIHQQNEGVVRLKSDLEFWLGMNSPAIGGFGVPWGPWGFGSGMGVEDADRDEAEQLGLLKPGDTVQPVDRDFNDKLQASTQGLDQDMVAKLKQAFGDQVVFNDEENMVAWSGKPAGSSAPPSPAPAPAAIPAAPSTPAAPATLDDVLKQLGLDAKANATADDMIALREQLKEQNPVNQAQVIKSIKGDQPAGALTEANIRKNVQEFLDFIPPAKVHHLPTLKISVTKSQDYIGQYSTKGEVQFSHDFLAHDPDRFRKNAFHELAHWLHREGDQAYRDAIRKHFEARTAGEKVVNLKPYAAKGKKDKWYEPYAGKIYHFETTPEGLEIPTRYLEWLTMTPAEQAILWNDPDFRETMKIVLQGLF